VRRSIRFTEGVQKTSKQRYSKPSIKYQTNLRFGVRNFNYDKDTRSASAQRISVQILSYPGYKMAKLACIMNYFVRIPPYFPYLLMEPRAR